MSMGMTMTSSASKESATGSRSSGSRGNGEVNVHVVRVGSMNGSFTFMPNDLQAQKGDMVQFQFMPMVSAACYPLAVYIESDNTRTTLLPNPPSINPVSHSP